MKQLFKRKIICPKCLNKFVLEKKNVYLIPKTAYFFNEYKKLYYEMSDCPHCGCQIEIGERIEKK